MLRNIKQYFIKLIIGVSTDKVKIKTNYSFNEKIEIVKAIKYVDDAYPQEDYLIEYKIKRAKELNVDVLFVGSDWQGTDKWNQIEKQLKEIGIDVVYLPHTDGISSSLLRTLIK